MTNKTKTTHADRTRQIATDVTADRVNTYRAMLAAAERADARGDVVARRQIRQQAADYYATRLGQHGRRIVDAG